MNDQELSRMHSLQAIADRYVAERDDYVRRLDEAIAERNSVTSGLAATIDALRAERDTMAHYAREYMRAVGEHLTRQDDSARDALDRAHDLLAGQALNDSSGKRDHREALTCTKCRGMGSLPLSRSNPRMHETLAAMPAKEPVSTIELAIHMGLKETTAFERLSWLEKAGLVQCVGKRGTAFLWRVV